ncbi:hypothetical protein QQP08_001463 [Theobroma cacao]|uniref:Uncharacterized protein n=1 Tax=Theobroma cacao TaxID=3641 RepID=A0A061DTR0_THECC|nr:Uncharacterized protein TCM_005188 [Theobroma cacao]WRX08976.1 hypothetical protein QQP08_001463 [Theobroma cacao]
MKKATHQRAAGGDIDLSMNDALRCVDSNRPVQTADEETTSDPFGPKPDNEAHDQELESDAFGHQAQCGSK